VGATQDIEDTVYSPCVKCGSQKYHWLFTLSHLVTNRRLRLFGHIARSSPRENHTEPLQRLSDKYRPTGSDQQEDLATLGSVQLRHTLAL